jgi:hypothetical protein
MSCPNALRRIVASSLLGTALAAASFLAVAAEEKVDVKSLFPPPTKEEILRQQATITEHQREMELLGLKSLRAGADPNDAGAANAVNYDEAKANPYPRVPDVLRMDSGKHVRTSAQWWKIRRPEIVAAFDREIYGQAPTILPAVHWEVLDIQEEVVGSIKVTTRRAVGRVDNAAHPAIQVEIPLTVTLPRDVSGRVPVIIKLTYNEARFGAALRYLDQGLPAAPDWPEQILARGWGYAALDPMSFQADDGAGLVQGIIGFVNKGQPRKANDWGVLRAWAWGASRVVDFLQADPHVAGDKIGIEGHSRYGKAALVAMAYDPRIAIGYIASSGAGGAKLMRRHYGETIENLAGSQEFHWFAAAFLKYAADPLTANDVPVDADALIALVAPRPIFISAGAQNAGDGWVDARGMFMAAAGAGPVYRLLGRTGLQSDTFPPLDTALLQGDIGFKQHRFGHTDTPTWPDFLEFAQKHFSIE